jgi:hypothetical protein
LESVNGVRKEMITMIWTYEREYYDQRETSLFLGKPLLDQMPAARPQSKAIRIRAQEVIAVRAPYRLMRPDINANLLLTRLVSANDDFSELHEYSYYSELLNTA